MNEDQKKSVSDMAEGYNQVSIESYRSRLTVLGFIWAAIGIVSKGQLLLTSAHAWLLFLALISASLGFVLIMIAYEIARYRYKKLQLAGESQVRVKQIGEWHHKIRQAQDAGSIDAERIAKDILWVIEQDEKAGKRSIGISFKSLTQWGSLLDIAGFICTLLAPVLFVLALIN